MRLSENNYLHFSSTTSSINNSKDSIEDVCYNEDFCNDSRMAEGGGGCPSQIERTIKKETLSDCEIQILSRTDSVNNESMNILACSLNSACKNFSSVPKLCTQTVHQNWTIIRPHLLKWRWGFQSAAALALAGLPLILTSSQGTYFMNNASWISVTAVVVLDSTIGDCFRKVVARVGGTILALIFALVCFTTIMGVQFQRAGEYYSYVLVYLCIVFSSFLWCWVRILLPQHPMVGTYGLSTTAILMATGVSRGHIIGTALVRSGFVILGTLIACFVSKCIWPNKARDKFDSSVYSSLLSLSCASEQLLISFSNNILSVSLAHDYVEAQKEENKKVVSQKEISDSLALISADLALCRSLVPGAKVEIPLRPPYRFKNSTLQLLDATCQMVFHIRSAHLVAQSAFLPDDNSKEKYLSDTAYREKVSEDNPCFVCDQNRLSRADMSLRATASTIITEYGTQLKLVLDSLARSLSSRSWQEEIIKENNLILKDLLSELKNLHWQSDEKNNFMNSSSPVADDDPKIYLDYKNTKYFSFDHRMDDVSFNIYSHKTSSSLPSDVESFNDRIFERQNKYIYHFYALMICLSIINSGVDQLTSSISAVINESNSNSICR